ncbi:MAG TPA: hypothetical protein PLJ58_03950, partial [bacterium]|nr:hypothetical protein [bacterium]
MKKQITLNRTASLIFATSLIAVTLLVQHFVLAHGDELEPDAEAPTTTAQSLAGVATVGSPETEALGLEQLAWSGEIVSQDDTNVVPAREGQIASWTVAIGDKVHKGQVLGKLVVSPANPELASLLAESKAAIIKAEAQRRQSLLASDSGRARLLKLQGLIDSAGQSAIIGIDKEVEKTYIVSSGLEKEIMATTKSKEASLVNVASELAQAETKEKLLQQQARADADRLMRQLAVAMGIYGLDSSSAYVRTEALPSIFGVADSKGRNQYLEKLGSLFEALKNNTVDIAENPATEYVKAAHRLLSATITNEELDADKLAALQALLSE